MKTALLICLFLLSKYTRGYLDPAQNKDAPNGNNVFIITLDGMRWQELFNGADSALIHDPEFTYNTAVLSQQYWHTDIHERRKKLMPFVWNTIARQGQLFGNRTYNNHVDVSNIYRLSYPGYNEIFTGKADLKIFSNDRKNNKNKTLLEHLNATPVYAGKVAAFTSWNLFSYILNEKRCNFYINCSPDKVRQPFLKAKTLASRTFPRFYDEGKNTRNDWLTFAKAQQYILTYLPKVVYVGLGGTDEYGHQKKYGHYLQQAHQADNIIESLWQMVQSIPFYKNNTTFIITTDHGRGEKKSTWYKHGFLTKGSSQTWLAMLGNGIAALGEHKQDGQLYQRQLAGTIGSLLGVRSFRNEAIPASFYTVAKR
jgi:hypothetical protein